MNLIDPLEAALAATVQSLLVRDADRLGLRLRQHFLEKAYFTTAAGGPAEIELLARRLHNLGVAGCCTARVPTTDRVLGINLQDLGFQLEFKDDDELS